MQKWATWALPRPFSTHHKYCMPRLVVLNVYDKSEVSILICYGNTKDSAKCQPDLGGQGSTIIISNVTNQYSAYYFLFNFSTDNASILYYFWVIASYLPKVADFNLSTWIWHPVGDDLFKFCWDLCHQETRFHWLSCGIVCMILGLVIMIQYQREINTHRHAMTADTVLA